MRSRWGLIILMSMFLLGAKVPKEIDTPAGELPQAEDAQEQPEETDGQMIDAIKETDPKTSKSQTPEESEKPKNTWDSYDDKGSGSAEEITKGVRVEDIIEPPSDYRYAAFGKGDPFVPPTVTEEAKMISPLEIPIVSPLQRYRLQELSVVGIWQLATGERKAMIMTPASEKGGSQGIIVKNSDPIGQKGGRILSIGDDYLTVREFTLSPDGTRQYEDQQMFMGNRSVEDVDGKIRFKPGDKNPEVIIEDANTGSAVRNDVVGNPFQATQQASREANPGAEARQPIPPPVAAPVARPAGIAPAAANPEAQPPNARRVF